MQLLDADETANFSIKTEPKTEQNTEWGRREANRMRNETDTIPDIFLVVLTPASSIHDHNTRFACNLNYSRPRVSTNLGKISFKFSASKIWETEQSGLKCLPYHKFKKEWKFCLLSNQIWSWLVCSITDIIWDFYSSLYCCQLFLTWRCPTRKLLLLWTPYTNELN